MALQTVNTLRKKNVIKYNGELVLVLDCVVRTPPNLRAFCQMQLRSLKTGRAFPVRCNANEQFELLRNDFRSLEYNYDNRDVYVFMDQKTYDTVEISREMLKDVVDFLVVNQVYDVMFVDDQPVMVDLPASVIMRVTEAPDAIRGDTSSKTTKTIKLETGLEVQAPLFIKTDELIKINTEDRTYQGRA